MSQLGHVTYLVRDYDEAIAYFTQALRFRLVEDSPQGGGKRWVVVMPPDGGTGLLLAQATTQAQQAAVGRQAGDRVFLFLYTVDFRRDHTHMQAHTHMHALT